MENKELDLNAIYADLINQYRNAIKLKNASELNDFLSRKDIVLFKGSPDIYVQLRSLRGNVAALIGNSVSLEKEFKLGFIHCTPEGRWEYLFDWVKAYWTLFYCTGSRDLKVFSANKIIEKVSAAKEVFASVPLKEFYQISLTGMAAFMHTYLGENQLAKAALEKCTFIPVPIPKYNDKTALMRFFANLFKALAVAIELIDRALLRKLITVISIDDQTLMTEQNLFRLFHFTLMNTIDIRPEFSAEFDSFFELSPALSPDFPNLRFFLDLIRVNDQKALDGFFHTFK